jgi:hypothetical protein
MSSKGRAKRPRAASSGAVKRVVKAHPRSYLQDRDVSRVRMPVVSWGRCKKSSSCGEVATDLANGLCVAHWDRTDSKGG